MNAIKARSDSLANQSNLLSLRKDISFEHKRGAQVLIV